MKILVATDAWRPQINGVVRSLESIAREAPAFGAEIALLTPQEFWTCPLPSYPEIRLALPWPGAVGAHIDAVSPDAIHIATEGPIGLSTRRYCVRRGIPFTTSFHTRFPEYLSARLPIPPELAYGALRRFHVAGAGTMVATASMERELRARGFGPVMRWPRGVDTDLFRPDRRVALAFARPIFLSVGRVAVEKNLTAFLAADLPGSKVVVGDGPARLALARAYPGVHFLGAREGDALAAIYAAADVFVFPSLTDTFGIVLLEALASGLPLAAYPVPGPLDVLEGRPECGVLSQDLAAAALEALTLDRAACRAHAMSFTWRESARRFIDNVRAAARRAPGFLGEATSLRSA